MYVVDVTILPGTVIRDGTAQRHAALGYSEGMGK